MNQFADAPIDQDPLYVGLTRPAMIAGITDVAFMAIMFVAVVAFVSFGGGKGIAAAIVCVLFTYPTAYLMCMRDPRIFDLWKIRLTLCGRANRQRAYWGGISFDPS